MSNYNNFSIDKVSIRLVKEATDYSAEPINNPQSAVKFVGDKIRDFDREVLCVINLSASGEPLNYTFASIGALNMALGEPRELLKTSILSNSANMILLHNHPGGSLTPSSEDIKLTDKMIQLCDLVGIPLLDHVIISSKSSSYFSFREKRILSHEQYKAVALEDIHFGIQREEKPRRQIKM